MCSFRVLTVWMHLLQYCTLIPHTYTLLFFCSVLMLFFSFSFLFIFVFDSFSNLFLVSRKFCLFSPSSSSSFVVQNSFCCFALYYVPVFLHLNLATHENFRSRTKRTWVSDFVDEWKIAKTKDRNKRERTTTTKKCSGGNKDFRYCPVYSIFQLFLFILHLYLFFSAIIRHFFFFSFLLFFMHSYWMLSLRHFQFMSNFIAETASSVKKGTPTCASCLINSTRERRKKITKKNKRKASRFRDYFHENIFCRWLA